MSNRTDFPFRQILTAADLDLAFANAEAADRDLSADNALATVDLSQTDGGVVAGLVPTVLGGLTLTIPVGTAYDNLGRRIRVAAPLTLDISQSGTTAIGAAGLPTGGASTAPIAPNERWLSVFIQFDRLLTDPRIDGAGATVFFNSAESFRFYVTQTADLALPLLEGTRPPMEPGRVHLCDLRRDLAGIVAGSLIATTEVATILPRRQDWFVRQAAGIPIVRASTGVPAGGRGIRASSIRSALDFLLGYYNDHVRNDLVSGTAADRHTASQIGYTLGPTWLDGATNPVRPGGSAAVSTMPAGPYADGVEGQLDKIVMDLIITTTPNSGSEKIGSGVHSTNARGGGRPVAAVPPAGAPAYAAGNINLAAGALDAQLTTLLNELNRMARITGDSFQGNLLPTATGAQTLGDAGFRWGAFLDTLNLTSLVSNVTTGGATRDLGVVGVATGRFNVFGNNVDVLGDFTPRTNIVALAATRWTAADLQPGVDVTLDCGTALLRWRSVFARTLTAASTLTETTQNQCSLVAAPADAAVGRMLSLTNKKGNSPFEITDMGHPLHRSGLFRDDMMYADSAGLLASNIWATDTAGPGPTSLISVQVPTTLGVMSVAANGTGGAGANTLRRIRTRAPFDIVVARGPHFSARAAINFAGLTGKTLRIGLFNDAGPNQRANFVSTDGGNWFLRVNRLADGVMIGEVDTGIGVVNDAISVFQIRFLTATLVEGFIDSVRFSVTTSEAYPLTNWSGNIELLSTDADAAAAAIRTDWLELYRA